MIREIVLVDAGPLVAILAEDDAEHERCVRQSQELPRPFLTTWPVLTEAAFLLRAENDGIPRLMALLGNGLVQCLEIGSGAGREIAETARKYADLRPDLADLSLVYVAHQNGIQTVFTLDRRDFTVYRTASGQPFRLLPE